MDRFFLQALVREVGPLVIGRRARAMAQWGSECFGVQLTPRPTQNLVISLLAEAPAFYVDAGPLPSGGRRPPERFKRQLVGAELMEIEPVPGDRVVCFRWRRSRPSGVEIRMDLIVEWAATRRGAYLVDTSRREVLDFITSGRPRQVAGRGFEGLKPPPGIGPIASDGDVFLRRVDQAKQDGLAEPDAARAASGLSPLLADEMLRRHFQEGVSWVEAFQAVSAELEKDPAPTLLRPQGGFRKTEARCVLSPIRPHERIGWTATGYSSFNEAAADFVRQATELRREQRRYHQAGKAIRQRLKKLRQRLEQSRREKNSLLDPAQMRRWGELLLAGHHGVVGLETEVEVPDLYDPDGGTVRIPVDPRFGLVANAERYFRRSRKTERSLESLEARILGLSQEIEYLELAHLDLEDAAESEDWEAVIDEMESLKLLPATEQKSKPKARSARRPGVRRFRGSGGGSIWVGRTGRSNEVLTFGMARPEDLWLHAAEVAGAHVVLRSHPGSSAEAGRVEIGEAAALAAYFSKARSSTRVEVIYTLRKNVRKIPAAPPGTVRVLKFGTMRVKPELVAPAMEEE